MGILRLLLRNLTSRPIGSLLTLLSVTVGVALMVGILIISQALHQGAGEYADDYDLVVGAQGSPTQLILSTLFHYENPVANIDYGLYQELLDDQRVREVVPIALGDSYGGYRIVGTEEQYLSSRDGGVSDPYAEGRGFVEIGEAVIGSRVAESMNLSLGDTFQSIHGFDDASNGHHHELEYTVVGILNEEKSIMDRSIFASVETYWAAHDHHHDDHHDHDAHSHDDHDHDHHHDAHDHDHHHDDHFCPYDHQQEEQVTALLVRTEDVAGRSSLIGFLEDHDQYSVQAVMPQVVLRQLMENIGDFSTIASLLALITIVIAIISIFISLVQSVRERQRDIAVMRILGATRRKVMLVIVAESLLITLGGLILGLAGGYTIAYYAGQFLQQAAGLFFNPWQLWPGQGMLILAVLSLGLLAGLIPALTVYRREPVTYLQ